MFFKILLVLTLVIPLIWPPFANAKVTIAEAAKSLPNRIGTFRARGPASLPASPVEEKIQEEEADVSHAERIYSSVSGDTFVVYVSKTRMDSAAYAMLTAFRPVNEEIKLGDIGTASVVGPRSAFFFKGKNFVKVLPTSSTGFYENEITELARAVSQQLEGGEKNIPALVKHLPGWERAHPRASYAVSLQRLKALLPNQPILDAVIFEGGAEAVMADYDGGKLLIVEFNTPQIATDSDSRITTRLNELRSQNQQMGPLPSAYRRVGNYSVFVFDAPSQETANQLIDQVKYQQVVQWLGDDPYLYERATREFTETTLGVFVAVVKASGLALVTCLAIGGLFGAVLFSRRRAQQRTVEAYSDAGGMVRLNLDEMTPQDDSSRLLGRGNQAGL
ncbi:MAG: DUF6599 family protein [Pyrinomonadaceae bacterium]